MRFEKKGYINENYHYFHLRDQEAKEIDYHFHEFDKLVYLVEGRVTYILENQEYEMSPGQILLVPHHTIHKTIIDDTEPYERIIIYFNRTYVRSLVPSTDIMYCFKNAGHKGRHLLQPDKSQLAQINSKLSEYEQSRNNTSEDSFGREAYEDALIIQFLVWLGRMHREGSSDSVNSSGSIDMPVDEKIQDALTYINENIGGELNVDILSEHVHLSRSYFMHLFRQETGMSVHESITQKRLLYAAKRIREGASLNEAAFESGYSEYSTFYRSFKKEFGISPAELKR